MKLAVLMITCAVICATAVLKAEGSCHKCEVIREENKKKVNPYNYYEDYLHDNPNQTKEQPQVNKTSLDDTNDNTSTRNSNNNRTNE
jgi:hypothetical protein